MNLQRLDGRWWITNTPPGIDGPIGDYDTRREAREARKRLRAFVAHVDEPGYITARRPTRRERKPPCLS